RLPEAASPEQAFKRRRSVMPVNLRIKTVLNAPAPREGAFSLQRGIENHARNATRDSTFLRERLGALQRLGVCGAKEEAHRSLAHHGVLARRRERGRCPMS
ncbi:unnamed protein product, partial [Phaeothamnion confervicola]